MLTEAMLGWMAGIIDFQGHVVRKNNAQRAHGSPQVVLYVETRTAEIITRLCGLTGNSVEGHEQGARIKEEWMRKSCGEHCPEPHVHAVAVNMPPMARWTITGTAMAVVLWNLREHMTTADEPWDWAMAMGLAGTRLAGQGWAAQLRAVRRLAELGWRLPPLLQDHVQIKEATA